MSKKIKIHNGIVRSDKMDKTIVVEVLKIKKHLKYEKRYKIKKRYKVHDPKNKFKIGENVKFVLCKPISKDKKFKVIY
ncbi:30S ribosomal protein S17 [bacterium]|nr:30S ribosomal protein S17 [bacterium]|tara:strand:+ start:1346 stop:1579 length:234 start_codon:yes stop_codon:yes gene_type:complete